MQNEMNRPFACAVFGASGRMGQQMLSVAANDRDTDVVAAWVGPASARLDETAHADWPSLHFTRIGVSTRRADAVIAFSRVDAFAEVLNWCVDNRVPLVSGTTGLGVSEQQLLDQAASTIPVLWSVNFSLGVAVLSRAVAMTAAALSAWDAEILEAHHAGKRDAPSGTALALGQVLARARGSSLDAMAGSARVGNDATRNAGEIGFAVMRAGDIVGDHTVMFVGTGERVELTHRALDRAIFARGALHAARWLAGRPAGRYTLDDCLD